MAQAYQQAILSAFLDRAFNRNLDINGNCCISKACGMLRGSVGNAWYTARELERCHEAEQMVDISSVQAWRSNS